MKTPQQIKNEVEKEIEKLKKTQPDVTIGLNGLHWIEKDKIKIMKLEAQLSILTEYDKSIKEMIEEMEDTHCCFTDWRNNGKRIWVKELLSKIGDVQQSKEKRNDILSHPKGWSI